MPRPFQIVGLLVFSSIVFSPIPAHSQAEAPAVVTFSLDFPTSQPEHYSIRVQSDGSGRYQSSGRLSADPDETDSHDNDSHNNGSFDLDFTLAAGTRQKIFQLAAKAGYFQKDVDSHHKNLAFTGKKTLGYKDERRSGESTYNYSTNPAVQDLTILMQSLSTTLEFGHRLQYDHHYQKLALDEELKGMEELARANQLIGVTAIQPILDQIIADPSVINVTRARAQRLLERADIR
ncbi:MAG TPA: hypothetical protein VJX30_15820 [Terriglobales bacterium]|jgi:hypothetical protein|nr:hypothetical protein [Terriglobales bacterium]